MNKISALVFSLLVASTPALRAQASGNVTHPSSTVSATATVSTPGSLGPSAAADADEDWRSLTGLLAPAALTAFPGKKPPAQIALERGRQADRLQVASQQAKDFHTKYPQHPNAAKAKKFEVTSLLESARFGNAAVESSALELAAAYRADLSHATEYRFEVALIADRYQLTKNLSGQAPRDRPREYETLADTLYSEFGEIHEVYGLYMGIAGEVDAESGNRIAAKVLAMRPPPFAMVDARAITARYELIGRPLRLQLTEIDGRSFHLAGAEPVSTPTVVCVWRPRGDGTGNPLAVLASQKAKLGDDVRWIYVGLGATAAQAEAAKEKAPFAGVHCIDSAEITSAAVPWFRLRSSPTVFVLDRQGVLTGYGRPDELPALLAAAKP